LRRLTNNVNSGITAEGLAGIGIRPGVGGTSKERIIVVVAANIAATVGDLYTLRRGLRPVGCRRT
jgi:hypothetical protein